MKRPFGFRLACAGLCLAAQAVAAATVDVRSHGAQGDGVTDDTAALQRAIDACAAQGGGRVVVPGGVYKTYTLSLKSDVDLHLERGATLKGGEDALKYPEFAPTPVWNVERAPSASGTSHGSPSRCAWTGLASRPPRSPRPARRRPATSPPTPCAFSSSIFA